MGTKAGESPKPAELVKARQDAGMSQTAAAALIYTPVRTWQEWEQGRRPMHPGLWELFNLKADGRPAAAPGPSAAAPEDAPPRRPRLPRVAYSNGMKRIWAMRVIGGESMSAIAREARVSRHVVRGWVDEARADQSA